jgi:hypothetical protein
MDLNIVELIEKNPITKLSGSYQSRLINKIKENFNNNDQQLFVGSFYCFLNYNQTTDFVIDLDNVWKWLGFSHKHKAKCLLEKCFLLNKDYKHLLNLKVEQKCGRGGHNKITILMNIKTFKSLCLKSGTKKADEIHEYYLKLEETLQTVLNEESAELRLQLENKDKLLENHISNAEKERELLREKTILEQFSNNIQCVYYGIIDDTTTNNERLIKFGNSNFLRDRVEKHKRTFNNFRLMNAFKVDNKIQIENIMKKHPKLIKIRRSIIINNTTHTELFNRDEITFVELDKIIKEIIVSIEYSPDNYTKILSENDKLNKTIMTLSQEIENLKSQKITINDINNSKIQEKYKGLLNKVLLLEEDNQKLKNENNKLIRKMKPDKNETPENITNDFVNDAEYNEIASSMKRITKNADGFYHINGCKYKKCFGNREEVWNGDAYKTTGQLTKSDFIINKNGKIVSKTKFLQEKSFNRLEGVNAKKKKITL